MSDLDNACILPDANGIIYLLKNGVRERLLNRLCAEKRLKIVDDVARELRRREASTTKVWVDRNRQSIVEPAQEVLDEVVRLAREYQDIFTVVGKAADPSLVATAIYYKGSQMRHLIVSDDHGVQAVCVLEQIEFVPCRAYHTILVR